MKKLTGSILLIIPWMAFSQPSVKLYAYSQVSTPGTVPAFPSENGNNTSVRMPGEVYYLYALLSPKYKITISDVWIHGKNYEVTTEKVLKTPVYSINQDHPTQPKTEILVPATKQQVLFISPVGEARDKKINATWFSKMLKSSEVIVSYFYKGKKYFLPLKKIKALQPVAGV